MKNIKYYIGLFLALALVFTSCQEDDATIGEIIVPSNVTVTAEIVGADSANPNGDGSGLVNFTASANNEITYQFNFGDGKTGVAPSGEIQHRFTVTGVNTYTVVVSAVGTGGILSSTAIDVEVFSSFSDEEAENLLAGELVGDSKTWYWAADEPLHVGLGPVTDDYGNGEFAYEAWWNGIQPWDEEKYCMYQNEFVFTRTSNGLTFEQTVGPAFVPGTYAGTLGVDGDTCHDESVVTSMFGVKNVSFLPSTSKAALEGSYNEQPYRGTAFEISDGGFMGWYAGTSTYDIIYINEDELHVRIIEAGGGFAWYQKFTSSKPVEGGSGFESQYNTLVWSDEFDTPGAPNSENWTYDLGAGGWGNGEAQTYTDDAENVIVEDGVLKITAKSDGSGGYTSARVKSQGLKKFTYGRIEAYAKLPAAQGTWPAIWMLGESFSTVGWPHCGEIDIMEQTGADKNTTLGTFHWFDSGTNANASYGETTAVSNASSEFHLYSIEWSEDEILVLLDNVPYVTLANNSNLPFNADFFLIMNIAMGGTLGGDIDPAFTEDTMEIDYIRVYQ